MMAKLVYDELENNLKECLILLVGIELITSTIVRSEFLEVLLRLKGYS